MINTDDSGKFNILSVGPTDRHQSALAEMLCRTGRATLPKLEFCRDLEAALPDLRKGVVPVVLCDSDTQPLAWRDLLDQVHRLPDPPYVIVTSRLADDRFWSEALNLGAYDVLAKPFEESEVSRVVTIAWLRWAALRGIPAGEENELALP